MSVLTKAAPSANTQISWDIFCKIVDNYGDIGVCWRLARQLYAEHGIQITLWIDDFSAAQKIIPSLVFDKNQQTIDSINITKWYAQADFSIAAEVVIEAFACELPTAYLNAMRLKKSKWVNLEYLSAESWVDDFHGKASPQANELTRHFYFPGFTEATGGLIRERDVFQCCHSDESRNDKSLNVLQISLFCYPHAPISELLSSLSIHQSKIDCYVPTSSILPKIAEYFGKDFVKAGESYTQDNLHLHVLPFLSQTDYDQLLKRCDLNFVRGEDSWVRAIWAAKPFIWQPYWQNENTHITKLNAFLSTFYVNFDEKKLVWEAHGYWLSTHKQQSALQAYLNALPSINSYTLARSQLLAKQTDLASKLVDFCNNI